jgi:hypothetical protein
MFKPFQSLYARMVDAMLLYAFLLKMLFSNLSIGLNSEFSDEVLGAQRAESGMYLKYMSISSTAQQRNSR